MSVWPVLLGAGHRRPPGPWKTPLDEVSKGSNTSGRCQREQFNDSDGIFDVSLVVGATSDGDGYLGAMTFNVRSA
jgi:hypothetical protein